MRGRTVGPSVWSFAVFVLVWLGLIDLLRAPIMTSACGLPCRLAQGPDQLGERGLVTIGGVHFKVGAAQSSS